VAPLVAATAIKPSPMPAKAAPGTVKAPAKAASPKS
jgi:hypothetical protein